MALPHRFGKEKTILVFAKGDKAEEARKAGAAHVGDADLIEKIKGGWLDFDVGGRHPRHDEGRRQARADPRPARASCRTPRRRPSPSTSRRPSTSCARAASSTGPTRAGWCTWRSASSPWTPAQLNENALAFISEIFRKRPADLKGDYVKSIVMSSTMGPGVKLSPKDKAFAA